MKQIMQAIDWILSLLPFNGNKLKIGALIEVAVHLHQMFPQFDVLAWLAAQLGGLGVPAFVIGVIHKIVKKYLDSFAPQLLTQSSAKAVTVIDPGSKAPVRPTDVSLVAKV